MHVYVHSLHGQNKELCSVLFCSACIFAWIHALFTLILLTHKIMIMFCICVGVPLALCRRLVLVCYHPKQMENEDNSG